MAKGDSYAASQLFMGLTPKNGFKASKLYCYKPTDGSGDFTWSRNLSSYRENQSGSLELMGVNVPRIDYINICPELLIEGARTNIITYSEDFTDTSWIKTSAGTGLNPVVTANATTAPNGATTADEVVFNSGAGTLISDQSVILKNFTTGAGTYNGSIWLKGAIGGEQLVFRHIGAGTYTLLTLTTEWQRFDITEVYVANEFAIGIRQGVNGTINSTATVYIWGAQLEQGSYASSYIPTTSTSVTRPQDTNSSTIAFTTTGFSYNLRVRLENRGDLSTPDNIFFISDNSGLSDVYAGCYVLGDNLVFTFYNNPDVQEFSISLADGIHNIGVALDTVSGDYDIVIDGASEFSGTLPDSFTSLGNYTRVKLGCLAASTDSIGLNRIIGLQVYNSVLSQAELIEYTTA